jgi:Tfp pilus assembly PilM family ATPase
MDTIIGELRRAVAYYLEKYKNEPVEAILLSGDTAKLPGMVVYLAENVGTSIEVQLANPWVGIKKDVRFNALNTEGPSFAVSVGLALR